MSKDLYNYNEDKYKHVVKLLKELPKEHAPDNFEYNLSVKIKNRNFDLNTPDKVQFLPWKIFAPAAGVIAASLLLFLTVFNNSGSIENPFQIQPKLRTEVGNVSNSSNIAGFFGKEKKVSETDVVIINPEESESAPKTDEVVQSDEELVADSEIEQQTFPFENYQSTNLDEVLNKREKSTSIDRRAALAGRNNSAYFNGFFIREEVDKKYVEVYKARMDSIKKVMRQNQKDLK